MLDASYMTQPKVERDWPSLLPATASGLAIALLLLPVVGAAPLQKEQTPVFTTGVEAVRLDIVVRGKGGSIVTDLQPNEVRVFEDGQPCAISSFRLVQSELQPARHATASGQSASQRAAAGTSPSLLLFVFDALGSESALRVRDSATDLLRRAFPTNMVFAVYRVDGGLQVLQSVTSNRAAASAAIRRATERADRSRDAAANPTRYQDATDEALSRAVELQGVRQLNSLSNDAAGSINVDRKFAEFEVRMLRFTDLLTREMHGNASLYALLGILQPLATLSGRKTLVYFSEGLNVPPAVEDVFQNTISAANRANVAIYSIDARGLNVRSDGAEARLALELSGGQSGAASSIRDDAIQSSQDAIRLNRKGVLGDLAESTGGLLISDTNDLRRGLDHLAVDLQSYYEVAYTSPNPKTDGRWRVIRVKVSRPGLTVRTRKGYFAFPPGLPIVHPAELPLMTALESASLPRDVDQRPAVLRLVDAGNVQQVLVIVEVPLQDVAIVRDSVAGVWRAHLQLLGHVKNEQNQYVARLSHDAPLEGTLAEAESAQRGNLVVRRSLRVTPGRYTLEIAVLDKQTAKVGARRFAFDVPSADGLQLGDVAIVRTAEATAHASADTDDVGEALRVGNLTASPVLIKTFPEGTPAISLFLTAHPGTAPQHVGMELEFRHDGKVVGRSEPALPAADDSGRIAYIGSFPTAQLEPGRYELWARAKQGDATAVAATSFTIAPAPERATTKTLPLQAIADDSSITLLTRPKPVTAPPDLVPILKKAGQYVREFRDSFRHVVAEETYRQWAGSKVRTLRSDLVFVTLPAEIPWATFRDVYEVDGQKVRDRESRLEAIFAKRNPSQLEQANAILRESARFNLGPIYRTVNLPTLALAVLQPENQWRFRWEKKAKSTTSFEKDGIELHATEKTSPTLVRERDGADLPLEARLWVEVGTGRVRRTEISFRRRYNPATPEMTTWIQTQYRPEPSLGLWVPEEMVERYENVPFPMREDMEHFDGTIQGRATYTNLRRFSVTIENEETRLPNDERDP